MFQNPFFLSVITAVGFGGCSLVARATGIPPLGVVVLLSIGTLASVSTVGPLLFSWDTIPKKMIYIGLLIGFVNGVSFLAYSKLLSNPAWDISLYVPLAIAMMLIVPVIGGPLFLGESMSPNKWLGIILILAGIYCIR